MLHISRKTIFTIIKEYGMMAIGIMIYSFAWVTIIIPADGIGGGATGLASLIYYATGGADGGLSIGIGVFLINAILLVAGVITLGAKFGAKTIYSIIVLALSMGFMQDLVPGSLLGLGGDKLLSAVLGGAVAGIGVSICLMQGGSTGGSDIVAMIVGKFYNISYGRVVTVVDFLIIGGSYFIFDNIATVIYGYILTATFGYTADAVLAGNRQSSQIFIMSRRHEEIADRISNNLHRGVTMLDGTGWYTKKPVTVLMVVCRKTEANMILKMIRECDPNAFITMGNVMGVYGEGFEKLKK